MTAGIEGRFLMSKRTFGLSLVSISSVLFLTFLASCATMPKLPPPPPKYVYQKPYAAPARSYPNNSVWTDEAGLYSDLKASRLNDLVTIDVLESITGTGTADTDTSRASSADASVTGFFGAPLDLGLSNLYGGGNTFSPSVSGSMNNTYKGAGTTDRTGSLVGTITAKVVQVLPNGNLVLEARKEITLNNERQILIFQGTARPYDIASNNTIPSSMITDEKVWFVGRGVVQEEQGPGWMARLLNKVWPF